MSQNAPGHYASHYSTAEFVPLNVLHQCGEFSDLSDEVVVFLVRVPRREFGAAVPGELLEG
jgi:hypothetical protein